MEVEKCGSLVNGCDCGARYLCWSEGSVLKGVPTPWSEIADRVHEIPLMNSVNLQYLKDGHLVRFRGTVQDMHNPEFYFENFEIINKQTKETRIGTGKYRDTSDIGEFEVIDYNSSNLKSAERQTITVISIPGFNSWAKSVENSQNVVSHLVNPPSTSKYQNIDSNLRTKRSLDLAENCESSNEMETDSVVNPNKERRSGPTVENQLENISRDHILNFPLPNDDGKVCLVKIYDNFDDLKLNDMVEITGYLSVDPALSYHWNGNAQNENEVDPDAEVLTHNPPPSLVPRIHAIHTERLKHCNPLVKQAYSEDIAETMATNAERAREHLHKIFTQICLGDSLAADYLLCHLISHVHIRQDVLPLGKLTLNLWKIPTDRYPDYTAKLYDLIQNIVTKSYYLPLSIDNLNDLAFCPKKDYKCNRLTSGILQLTKNTHLILDETKMQPGQLNNAGVQNITSLGEAILNQKVKYDFKFYTMEYSCDIPFLILSEGKSLLPNDVSLPLVADNSSLEIVNETFEAAKHYLTAEILTEIRIYLTLTQLIDYQITEEPLYIQEDFVAMRKNSQKREIDAQDLHRLLTITRLICISKGYKTIDKSCWEMAKQMEEDRFSRLS